MLEGKYKEIETQLSELQEDNDSNKKIIEAQRKKDYDNLIKQKADIRSNKKYHKVSFGNYWFRFKLFLWKLVLRLYN
jgi:hypothetical protein